MYHIRSTLSQIFANILILIFELPYLADIVHCNSQYVSYNVVMKYDPLSCRIKDALRHRRNRQNTPNTYMTAHFPRLLQVLQLQVARLTYINEPKPPLRDIM